MVQLLGETCRDVEADESEWYLWYLGDLVLVLSGRRSLDSHATLAFSRRDAINAITKPCNCKLLRIPISAFCL